MSRHKQNACGEPNNTEAVVSKRILYISVRHFLWQLVVLAVAPKKQSVIDRDLYGEVGEL